MSQSPPAAPRIPKWSSRRQTSGSESRSSLPRLLEHARLRGSRPVQAGGRIFTPEQFQELAGGKDKLTLPRDNPMKKFLISADEKFARFHAEDPEFYGLLAIVWDDFIFEVVTALLHPTAND